MASFMDAEEDIKRCAVVDGIHIFAKIVTIHNS